MDNTDADDEVSTLYRFVCVRRDRGVWIFATYLKLVCIFSMLVFLLKVKKIFCMCVTWMILWSKLIQLHLIVS